MHYLKKSNKLVSMMQLNDQVIQQYQLEAKQLRLPRIQKMKELTLI